MLGARKVGLMGGRYMGLGGKKIGVGGSAIWFCYGGFSEMKLFNVHIIK